MIPKDLISDIIIPLKTSDTSRTAQEYMEEYKVSHLPIVNNNDFFGLVSEVDIYSSSPDTPIGDIKFALNKPLIFDYQNIFDVFKVISDFKLSLVPVTDEKNFFLGVITTQNLVYSFSKLLSVENPGSVIVLKINVNSYSLTEISKIIESNNARILNMFTKTFNDSTELEVIIKVNKIDINPILQTFNRYNYIIKEYYTKSDYKNQLSDRYNELMNYLNI